MPQTETILEIGVDPVGKASAAAKLAGGCGGAAGRRPSFSTEASPSGSMRPTSSGVASSAKAARAKYRRWRNSIGRQNLK